MQVQCPHCAAQFETQRSGLQFCPNCGQQIQVSPGIGSDPNAAFPTGAPPAPGGSAPPPSGEIPPMGAPPPGGPPPPRGPSIRQDTPWERRRELGFVNALVETWKQTIVSPEKFWSSVRPDGRWEDALFYAWIIGAITLVAGLIIKIPFQAMLVDQMRRQFDALESMSKLPPEFRQYLEAFIGGRVQVWWTVVQIIFLPIGIFIAAALVHLFCILFGCATNGFWATFRAISYAQAPIVFSILAPVPCLGQALAVAAFVYTIVLQIWGVMRVQETSGGKAAAAVLATPVLACCCCCGVAVLAGSALKSMISGGN
jgi:hypothetical protein